MDICRRYSSQLLRSDDAPSNMMNDDNVEPSITVDVQTVFQHVNESRMPKFHVSSRSSQIFCCELRKSDTEEQRHSWSRCYMIRVDLDIVERVIKNAKGCEKFFCEKSEESIKADGSQRVLMSIRRGNNEGHGTLYVKNICEVFQR